MSPSHHWACIAPRQHQLQAAAKHCPVMELSIPATARPTTSSPVWETTYWPRPCAGTFLCCIGSWLSSRIGPSDDWAPKIGPAGDMLTASWGLAAATVFITHPGIVSHEALWVTSEAFIWDEEPAVMPGHACTSAPGTGLSPWTSSGASEDAVAATGKGASEESMQAPSSDATCGRTGACSNAMSGAAATCPPRTTCGPNLACTETRGAPSAAVALPDTSCAGKVAGRERRRRRFLRRP
jgi:hypothetical protein